MEKLKYDFDMEIAECLTWGMLKYGYCSYFALAFAEKHNIEQFLAVMEYDDFIEKEYLVHILVVNSDGAYLDSEGTFVDPLESVTEIVDVEFMQLSTKTMTSDQIRDLIEYDIGFDNEFYGNIKDFVQKQY